MYASDPTADSNGTSWQSRHALQSASRATAQRLLTPTQIRKVLLYQVKRIRQIPGSADFKRGNSQSVVDRTLVGLGKLERRAAEPFQVRHQLGPETPERRVRERRFARRDDPPGKAALDLDSRALRPRRRLAPDRDGAGRVRARERAREAGEIARPEDRVGRGDEERWLRPGGEPAGDHVGRSVRTRLARIAKLQSETGAVAEQTLDLLREMPRHDGDALAAGAPQLAQQRRDHRVSVDRQGRFRPAFGHRPQPPALAGGHHDRFDHAVRPSERSERAPRARSVRVSAARSSRRRERNSRRAMRAAARERTVGPNRASAAADANADADTPSSASTSCASSPSVALGE